MPLLQACSVKFKLICTVAIPLIAIAYYLTFLDVPMAPQVCIVTFTVWAGAHPGENGSRFSCPLLPKITNTQIPWGESTG